MRSLPVPPNYRCFLEAFKYPKTTTSETTGSWGVQVPLKLRLASFASLSPRCTASGKRRATGFGCRRAAAASPRFAPRCAWSSGGFLRRPVERRPRSVVVFFCPNKLSLFFFQTKKTSKNYINVFLSLVPKQLLHLVSGFF